MTKIPEELKKIVLWKLDTVLPNYKLSIGDKGTFTKEELIDHVNKEDDIGTTYSNMQLKFMKALANGEFTKKLAS